MMKIAKGDLVRVRIHDNWYAGEVVLVMLGEALVNVEQGFGRLWFNLEDNFNMKRSG